MGNRIRWILVSYFTNRLFLTALVIATIYTAGITWFNYSQRLRYQSSLPPAPQGVLAVTSVGSLAEVRRLNLQAEVDAIDLGSLWSNMEIERQRPANNQPVAPNSIGPPPPSFYDILNEFPNLRLVTLGFHDNSDGLSRVVKLPGITYLKVGFNLEDFAPLATLENLQRVDVDVYQPVRGVSALAKLPQLETIILASEMAITNDVLAEFAELPHLKTLGIRASGVNREITAAGWARLAKSPSLETLYVGGNDLPRELDLLAQARQALPRVDVRPAVVPPKGPLGFCFPPAILAAVVGYLLAGQSRCVMLRIAPGFAFEHSLVAIGWCVATALAVTTGILAAGSTFAAGTLLAPGVVAIAFLAGVESFMQRNCGSLTGFRRWESQLQGIAILGLAACLFLPPDTLARRQPWVLLGFLAVGTWCVLRGIRLLRLLPSLEGAADQREPTEFGGIAYKPGWWFATTNREREIDRLNWETANRSRWSAIQHWRLGNPPLRTLNYLLLAVFGGVVMTFVMLQTGGLKSDFLRVQAVTLTMILLLMACAQVSTIWRKRLRSLDVESLRPVSTARMRRELAFALAIDLVVPAVCVAAFAALAINLPMGLTSQLGRIELRQLNWTNVPWDFARLLLVLWAVSTAICGMLVVVERGWVRLLLVYMAVVAMIAATVGVAALQDDLPRYSVGFPRVLLPYLWVPIAIAGAAIVWLWRIWSHLQFDRQR